MRIALRIVAAVVSFLGVVAATTGIVVAAVVGTDDTYTLIKQPVTVSGVAWTTAPGFFTSHGPTLHISARSQDTKQAPIFVGVAPSFQVADYVKDKRRSELTQVARRGSMSVEEVAGSIRIEPPGELDFWSMKSKGAGGAELAWTIPNGQNSVVIMRSNGSPVGGIDLEAGVELDGLFVTAAVLAGAGLLGIVAAVVTFVATRRRAEPVAAGVIA